MLAVGADAITARTGRLGATPEAWATSAAPTTASITSSSSTHFTHLLCIKSFLGKSVLSPQALCGRDTSARILIKSVPNASVMPSPATASPSALATGAAPPITHLPWQGPASRTERSSRWSCICSTGQAALYRIEQRVGGARQELASHKGQRRASQSCQPAGLPARDKGARCRCRHNVPLDNLPFHNSATSCEHEFTPFCPVDSTGRAHVQTRLTFGAQLLVDGRHTLAFIQTDRAGRTGVYTCCTSRARGPIYVQQIVHLLPTLKIIARSADKLRTVNLFPISQDDP